MLTVRAFAEPRKPRWDELRALVERANGRGTRLDGDELRRLGETYRAAAADLSALRARFPGDPLVDELMLLVRRGHALVYGVADRRDSPIHFLMSGYWRLVAKRRVALLVASACLFGSALVAGTWAVSDPGAAAGLVPAQFRSVTEPRDGTDLGIPASEQAGLATVIFTNNIRVTLLTFAAGVLLGVGSALVLVYNGVLLGVIAGLSIDAGNGRELFQLVVAHGVLELSCIVVAGAAGLTLGWALVDPGTRTRRDAVLRAARPAVLTVLGTAPWLVLAGLVEGFVTGTGLSLRSIVVIGVGLGAVYWVLVVTLGRGRPGLRDAPALSP